MIPGVLDVTGYSGEGCGIVVRSDSWRIGIINDLPRLRREETKQMHCHLGTDEAFVLLNGRAWLYVGGKGVFSDDIKLFEVKPNRIYNIKMGVWHAVIAQSDTVLVIVENESTSKDNTLYHGVETEMLPLID